MDITSEKSEPLDKRQREVLASREKRLMLGNIRFIGELFKADLLNVWYFMILLFCMILIMWNDIATCGPNMYLLSVRS